MRRIWQLASFAIFGLSIFGGSVLNPSVTFASGSERVADRDEDHDVDFDEDDDSEDEADGDGRRTSTRQRSRDGDRDQRDRDARSRDRENDSNGKARSERGGEDAKDKSRRSKEKDDKDTFRLAVIRLDNSLPEGANPEDIFSVQTGTLLDVIRRLKEASEDDKVHAILLEIRSPVIGRGKLFELQEAIRRVRKSGKKVYAHLEMGTTGDYLVACACDRIIMPESGDLILPGIRAEVMFYRRLFDKLGIEPDMLQCGDFKGAAEPFMREKMSAPFRKQIEVVLDDYFEQMIEDIAEARDLDEDDVREYVDKGMFSAEEAKKAGFIDEVAYDSDWQSELLDDSGRDELKMLKDYAETEVDTDFSGMAGFVKLMELLSGGKASSGKSDTQRIAIVYAVGAITSGESSSSMFGETSMGSDTIVAAIREAAEDESVAAIVLRVDSPGGSALASDLIWNAIQDTDKPVIASMGDVAASGGYYISMGCDKIFAEPGTLTGSIGVVGGKLVMGKMFEKFGLTTDVISRGKNSGLFSANERFSDSEREAWQAMMDEVYRQFTSKAAEGRDMDVDDLLELAGGRVWTGRQAKKNGLIDEIGTLRDAVREAQDMAGMDASDEPELLILPESKSIFEQIFSGNSAQASLIGHPLLNPKLLAELQQIERLFAEPGIVLMPYTLEIK